MSRVRAAALRAARRTRFASLLVRDARFATVVAATLAIVGALAAPAHAGEEPSGAVDVRTFGATCDGRTDTAAAFQKAYDTLQEAGGTILVPAGARCAIGGAGVEPRSKVALRCEHGSAIVALPGARALFRTAATLDDWSVTGCDLDLNGVAAPAWEASGGERGGVRWEFRGNTVHGMPGGDGPALSAVRLDCTLAGGPCVVADNAIFGSESAARRDTCLTITPGGFIGFNTQVTGNFLQGCGGDCLEVRRPGGVTASDNVLVRCFDNAVDNASLNSVWTGNQLATSGAAAGALMTIHDTIGNQVIVGNQFAVNPRSTAPAIHAIALPGAHLAGLYLDSNYAAQGVFFDARGRCEGGTCDAATTCDDDAGCGACGGRCAGFGVFDHDHVANLIVTGDIRIESATNLVVQGNVVIGTAGAGTSSQIALVNPRGDRASGGIVVSGNQLGKRAGPQSSLACIELDDLGGGGFAGLTITGNTCGEDPAIAPQAAASARPHGVRLTRPPRVWRSVLIADNNFGATADALVGFASPQVRAATRLSGNLGLEAGDAQPVVETLRTATQLAAFSAVGAARDADLAVTAARSDGTAALGCTLAASQAGASVPVAVAGIADCLVIADAGTPVARGDALAASAEPGHLAKAPAAGGVLGYALEESTTTRALRVLIQPAAARAAAGATRVARVKSDRGRADSATPTAEPALGLPLAAGATYAIDGHLRFRAADDGTGLAADVALPADGAASLVLRPAGKDGASALVSRPGAPVRLALATGDGAVAVSGTVTTGATAGTFELRWAQGTPGPAPLVLQAGSWLRATELP